MASVVLLCLCPLGSYACGDRNTLSDKREKAELYIDDICTFKYVYIRTCTHTYNTYIHTHLYGINVKKLERDAHVASGFSSACQIGVPGVGAVCW